MIYKLQKRFIAISGISLIVVFTLMFGLICVFSLSQLNKGMDALADNILIREGSKPEFMKAPPPPDNRPRPGFITEETRFSIRFFVVDLDKSGNIMDEHVENISSITKEDAKEYAKALDIHGESRGWLSRFRYKIVEEDTGYTIIFVEGSNNRFLTQTNILAAGFVLIGSAIIIMLLIIIFSKRAVAPVAESYDKQRQFITDANHELKTPLTLILTNLEIAESELGKNEWLEDIRSEGERMSALVNQLVDLSRMDEDQIKPVFKYFALSETVSDTLSEFEGLAAKRGQHLTASVEEGISFKGDEAGIRRLLSILIDNAIKYCDPGGDIDLKLTKKRHLTICVENTYQAVDTVELNKLFDRFYRQDKSRSFTGSFGIGLSIAQAIVHQHHGEILAYKKDETHIGFKVTFKHGLMH